MRSDRQRGIEWWEEKQDLWNVQALPDFMAVNHIHKVCNILNNIESTHR